jgi:hypothetical protein
MNNEVRAREKKVWNLPAILETASMANAQGGKGGIQLVEGTVIVGGIYIAVGPHS